MFHILLKENNEKKKQKQKTKWHNLCFTFRSLYMGEICTLLCSICTWMEFIGHVSLISSPPFIFLRWDFFTEPLLIWLGSFKALPLCLPHNPALSPSITDEDHHAQSFYEGAGKQNSGPHVYVAEMILTEPSLQSLNSLFRLISQYDKSLSSFLVVLLFTPIVFSISFNFF